MGANVLVYTDAAGVGTFRYRVRAFNAAGNSAYTGWATIVMAPNTPAPPTSLVVADQGNERDLRLSWNDASDNEDTFLIQRQTQVGGQWTSQIQLTAPANAVTLVDPAGTGTFRYRVAASNSAGPSAYTAWATTTVTSGWTQLTPSPDTRFIYVSSVSGNDSNNGLSEGRAQEVDRGGLGAAPQRISGLAPAEAR